MPDRENRLPSCKITPADILDLLHRSDYSPMTGREMCEVLNLRGKGRKRIGKVLHQMVREGTIVIIRKNRYSLGEPADLVTGRLEVGRSGDGFLAREEGAPRVVIPKDHQSTALPGDLITVRLEPQAPGRPDAPRVGKVIRVLDRGKKVIVGTLKSTGRFHYVVPLDPAYDKDFYVADPGGAQVDDRVVIQFVAWEHRHVNPEAEVVDVIGPADNPSLDTLATIRQFSLPERFPPEVFREAEEAAALMDDPGPRLDLREKYVLTIDPERARDFDDALSLDVDGNGNRRLGVHIADVSHFVARRTATDKEARTRGNSVYLPDKVLPMLPEQLSNGLCSLKPNQDRLAFSVLLTIDGEGKPVACEFAKTIIRSRLRLTYEQVMAVLRVPEGMRDPDAEKPIGAEGVQLLRRLSALAQQMRQRRFAQYALDLDMPEYEVIMDKGGMIADLRLVMNNLSHQLIEECMVAANEAVDRHLSNRGFQLLHRVHDPPSPERIAELTERLIGMGYRPGDMRQRRNMASFLKSLRDDPMAYHVRMAVLRSLKRAVYSVEPRGHFGLAKKLYTHFTSPIRRYPDLIVHRVLQAALTGRPSPYESDELGALGLSCSQTEQTADEAERFLLEIKKYRFLEQQLEQGKPRVYEAVIVGIRNFGMFVELIELQVQGLVHVSAISDRFVRYDPVREALRCGNMSYLAGMKVKVFVARVDFDKRRLDFALHREPVWRPGEGRREKG